MTELIALDLDGTLLNSQRKILKRDYEAVRMAIKNGIKIVISTGSPFGLMPHKYLGGLDISYAITANGSAVYQYRTGKCLFEEGIDENQVLQILSFLSDKDVHADIFINGNGFCPIKAYHIVEKLDVPLSRKNYLLNNRLWLKDPIAYIQEHKLTVQKMTFNFYPDHTGNLVDRNAVKDFLEHNSTVHIVSGGWGNLEVTQKGVSKGNALKKLCEKIHIPLDRTLAIGDSLNDLDMIQVSGIGIAMGNAIAEVMDAADYITKSNDSCGVAEVIETFYRGDKL